MIRYDESGNVIETHDHAGDFKGGAFTFAPENGAPKVTTALPPMRDRRYFSNPDGASARQATQKPLSHKLRRAKEIGSVSAKEKP